ncbi:cornifelin homolog B-like [Bombina bombina]|uniref:cornifelin homolog B-like n=1 Tax=Bombina bombina TaxID=8345 RepID=UPI00235AF277|nr:cornifelin homolog B-like [Bombina bombina]
MASPVVTQPQVLQGHIVSQWSTELMDCCDDKGTCLLGAFCPPILACKVASAYGECCCLPVLFGSTLALRTGIRERYHIPGSICNDCVYLTFLAPCALCQMARELKRRMK